MRKLPPYADLLGVTLAPADSRATLMMPFGGQVLGRPGFLHGGAIAGLLELAAFASLELAIADLDPQPRIKPINMTIDFMRGGREAMTYARGTVGRLGQRIANIDVVAWQDDEDRLIARAHINFLLAGSASA
ncbi:PaaI family thioesterase [Sphingorhabdus soli]|uniref:PaaI family thioesterase n=1 Tax=Flavisphingopyxis soli TaxID=2601267 RepID=A0A5C6USG7_9SPHN|nr:PaaI family thioesterase [Sphingorhabdus soli]TXC73808.1 PaaI family thioesterase [Sphingorhabdus soli]